MQGLILHAHWVERYGIEPNDEREQETNLRKITRQLARLMELDGSPLTVARPPERRVVGTCRDFSTFLAAFLHHHNIPTRARCGFGTYFTPGRGEDHWICQYWNVDEAKWVTVDAELDQFKLDALGITFNPLDMPEGQFLTAGQVWQLCRAGEADPNRFGFPEFEDMKGLWFIRGNLILDLAAQNKRELLLWDNWGLMSRGIETYTEEEWQLLDKVAVLTQAGNKAFAEMRAIYEEEIGLKVPRVVKCYSPVGEPREVTLPATA